MTPADVKAMDAAFKEKQAAEDFLQVAFRERKSKEEIDNAIRRFEQAKQNYRSFTDKFFENYPA
jgi:cysteine sulfinate desulfinase/cysteine desulfurase-like protein